MTSTLNWFLLIGFLSCVSPTQKLYYYGAPLKTSETGFIKLDPSSGAWELAAKGFATTNQYSYYGIIVNPNGDAFMYGQLQLWNGSYVGNMLRLDMNTLTPSVFTTGVLGSEINGMTYFDNFNQVALIGNFLGFQQNPSVVLNNVGACTVDGKSCYPLGDGFPDFWSGGSLCNLNEVLYALYLDATGNAIIQMYNTNQPELGWIPIYTMDSGYTASISMAVFQDSVWIVGSIHNYETGQNASAARWNNTSWVYMEASRPWDSIEVVQTTVSPDGQNMYLESYAEYSSAIYQWDNQNEIWTTIQNLPFEVRFAATNDGIITGEKTMEIMTTDGQTQQLNVSCDGVFITLTVSQDNSLLYSFCFLPENSALQVTSFNIDNQVVISSSIITGFQDLVVQINGLCVYGQKIMVAGYFDNVDVAPAKSVAIWDYNYQKWYQVTDHNVKSCACGTDGNMVAVACSVTYGTPVLIVDYANSDTGTQQIAQNTQLYNLTDLTTSSDISQVAISDSIVYISATGGLEDPVLILGQFTPKLGLVFLWEIYGTNLFFSFFNNTFYISGNMNMDSNTLTAIGYDMNDYMTFPMDQLYIKSGNTYSGVSYTTAYWPYTNLVYVGGRFDEIGTMRTGNWGGYNLDGTAEDSVAGGVLDWVLLLQPVDSRMYLVSRPGTCTSVLQSGCGSLMYYDADTRTYSTSITQGVVALAVGEDSTTSNGISSAKDIGWLIPVCVASSIACTIFFVIVIAMARKYRNQKRGHRYQEIPVMESTDYSASPIDFQHDEFVMKSALGRGAYGTVWSCVFPNREGGTYAVKQMLFSKGDTKKIEIVKQEIDILEKFRHPNIVHYCGHRMETNPTSVEFFIFMELYDQPCSLKGVIQKRLKQAQKTGKNEWFSYEEIKKFLIQISEGLHYLHLNGVAHRDLKCANILVRSKDGNVTSLHIADFGISRVINPEEHNVLASTVLGTPSFMAPEILSNQKYDAFKADVWSFGMMMYEMITWSENQIPGKKPQFPQDIVEFMNQDSRFDGILEIFDKCTQQEPNSRPTASDLLFLCESLS